jgi:hypothetical protein
MCTSSLENNDIIFLKTFLTQCIIPEVLMPFKKEENVYKCFNLIHGSQDKDVNTGL